LHIIGLREFVSDILHGDAVHSRVAILWARTVV